MVAVSRPVPVLDRRFHLVGRQRRDRHRAPRGTDSQHAVHEKIQLTTPELARRHDPLSDTVGEAECVLRGMHPRNGSTSYVSL